MRLGKASVMRLGKARGVAIVMAIAAAAAGLVVAAPAAGAQTSGVRCTITGTAANDTIRGTAGADVICGLGGNDSISGLGGNDLLLGGPGNDSIDGGPGNDTVDGSVGNDRLIGADGNDQLSGSDGADVLAGGLGNDRIDGGAGTDAADFASASAPIRANLAAGTATGQGTDTLTGDENLTGGPADDVLVGDGGANAISGGAGNDAVTGGAGDDALAGGVGNDRLAGGDGQDVLDPGSGNNACQTGDRVVGTCTVDGSGPVISGFSVPAVVAAGSTVTFSWRLLDPAGVQHSGLSVGWAPGIYTGCGFGQSATLVSGTVFDGQWSLSCTFPADAVATDYSAQVVATDFFGNATFSDWASFRIEGANADSSPPAFSDIRLSGPVRVGEAVTVTWSATDASGIDGAIMWFAAGGYSFADSTGRPYVDYSTPVDRRCDAARTVCSFSQTVQVRADAPTGQWALWISITDVYANKTFGQVLSFPVLGPAAAPSTAPTTSTTASTTASTTTTTVPSPAR